MTTRERKDSAPLFAVLVALALAATLVIVVLSAYIRLDKAGAGCAPWPECYGERVVETSAFAPPTGASMTHRMVASMLAVAVIVLAFISLRKPRRASRVALAWLAFILVVFLAVLGVYTPSANVPAITVGNLLGGFALLSVLWWLYLDLRPPAANPRSPRLRLGIIAGFALSLFAVCAGALAASHLAGAACATGCPWLSDPTALGHVDLFAPLPSSSERHAVALSLHALHRLVGVLTAISLLVIAWRLHRSGSARAAVVLAILVLVQAGIGAVQVALAMPLLLTVAHNAVAAMLLLALLANLYRLRAST